jgi:HSP20 family protein
MAHTRLQRRRRELVPFTSILGPEPGAIEEEFRRFFTDPFAGELLAPATRFYPPAEISETAEEFTVTAEAPGMESKDLQIEFEKGILTIRGEKEEKQEKKERRYHLVERSYGSFQRSFSFPGSVDSARIAAAFDNGVLTVHLPKTPEARGNSKRIEIAEAGKK